MSSASSIGDGREVARTGYVRESHALQSAGADAVFSGEGEVALAMTAAILQGLGDDHAKVSLSHGAGDD